MNTEPIEWEWDFDTLTTVQIKDGIAKGFIDEAEVIAFYNNEFWDDYDNTNDNE